MRHPKALLVQLVDALRNNWLEVWYQPKIDLRSLTICGAEALVRARHPSYGVIAPAQLLPPAIRPISRCRGSVIDQAMADWGRFVDRGLRLRLAVNVPVSVIQTPNFITMVRSALLPKHASFPGLTIEITEDEIIDNPQLAREIATAIEALQCRDIDRRLRRGIRILVPAERPAVHRGQDRPQLRFGLLFRIRSSAAFVRRSSIWHIVLAPRPAPKGWRRPRICASCSG